MPYRPIACPPCLDYFLILNKLLVSPLGVTIEGKSPKYHEWEPFPPYEKQHQHPWSAMGLQGSHGGTDGLELHLFFEAVRNRKPLPLDVYDSVTMSAIVDLSGQSIAQGGQPIAFPDFTRGKWKSTLPKFALDSV